MAEPLPFRPPVPASTILSQLLALQTSPSRHPVSSKLTTGLAEIDSHVLRGGIPRGCVVGISSGVGAADAEEAVFLEGLSAGRLVALHLLVRSLLERPGSRAAIVDSTGGFPLRVLARVVRWQVERRGRGLDVGEGEGGVEERVNGVLERVSITRVFDVEGLWEVLGELRSGTEQTGATTEPEDVVQTSGKDVRPLPSSDASKDIFGNERDERRAGNMIVEIMDSEEEDDDDDLSSPISAGRQISSPKLSSRPHEKSDARSSNPPSSREPPTTEIILIDTLTSLITTLFANTERSNAHTILASLSHVLTSLTRSSNLAVFLLNTLTSRPSYKVSSTQGRQTSIFAGVTSTPSLGIIFDNFVDLHLICHSLPATAEDAEKFYDVRTQGSEDGERAENAMAGQKSDDVRFANVIEVLRDEAPGPDRWIGVQDGEKPRKLTSREQMWAAFGITDTVGLAKVDFDPPGERERTGKGGYQNVGFGRRP
jgi:hypothetical protein